MGPFVFKGNRQFICLTDQEGEEYVQLPSPVDVTLECAWCDQEIRDGIDGHESYWFQATKFLPICDNCILQKNRGPLF